jgi:uncharacterized protein
MDGADGWFICRVGFVEAARALGLSGGRAAVRAFREEWPAFGVIEVDQDLVERASKLAVDHELRSLDALHLAAALVLPRDGRVLATWDRRLHAAGEAEGLDLLPVSLD